MTTQNLLARNRVILTHFDSYSAALLLTHWDNQSLLWPEALPVSALPAPSPTIIQPEFSGPVRIHLLRFNTLDAPKAAIRALGGEFKPIRMLRGSAMSELLLLREVFNLIVGSGTD